MNAFQRTWSRRGIWTKRNFLLSGCVLSTFSLTVFLEIGILHQNNVEPMKWKELDNSFHESRKRILHYQAGKWLQGPCQMSRDQVYTKVKLSAIDADINVHRTEVDKWVTSSLLETGSWKGNLSLQILQLLRPETILIDIGSHVGSLSIPAAIAGYYVIAVDVIKSSLNLICQTADKYGVQQNFLLINNAVSGDFGTALIRSPEHNIGASTVEDVTRKMKFIKYNQSNLIDAIPLNALLSLIRTIQPGKRIVLKMSVEGYEHQIIKKAEEFFRLLDVQYVILEFSKHRRNASGVHIRHTMRKFGMEAMLNDDLLNAKYPINWPATVIWRKVKGN